MLRGTSGLLPTDTFQPFSNGHEHRMWEDNNCCRGKGCRNYNPNAATSRDGCPMEVAISLAAASDGQITVSHGWFALVIFDDPAPEGERNPHDEVEKEGQDA